MIPLAESHGLGQAFVSSFMHGVWAEGIDAGSDRGLRRISERAGLAWADSQAALADEAWRNAVEFNRFELFSLGLRVCRRFASAKPRSGGKTGVGHSAGRAAVRRHGQRRSRRPDAPRRFQPLNAAWCDEQRAENVCPPVPQSTRWIGVSDSPKFSRVLPHTTLACAIVGRVTSALAQRRSAQRC